MKIGVIIASFLPGVAYGGVASVAAEQAKELALRGHQITILTSDIIDPSTGERVKSSLNEYCHDKYWIIRFSSLLLMRRFAAIYSLKLLKWLFLHWSEFDFFYIHYARGFIPMLPVELLYLVKAKYYLQPHGMLDRVNGVRSWIDIFFTKKHIKHAEKVFALHASERRGIKELVPDAQISILPNGIRIDKDFPAWKGLGKYPKIILFLGRLHPRKRVLTFIDVAKLLLAKRSDLKFRIVGPDGGDELEARKKVETSGIEKFVEFVGPVHHDMVYHEYANAAIYILPTEYENFSISVLEALMVGIPTIVTTTTLNLGILDSSNAVYVSEPDASSLGEAIETLVDHPEMCFTQSKNGKILINKQLNISHVVDILEEHFNEE